MSFSKISNIGQIESISRLSSTSGGGNNEFSKRYFRAEVQRKLQQCREIDASISVLQQQKNRILQECFKLSKEQKLNFYWA